MHHRDGYPSTLEDAPAFLLPASEHSAWVAVDGDVVTGHVALHDAPWSSTVQLARAATGRPPADHLLVSRLFTDPAARRRGTARALLSTARRHADDQGRRAVLDVGRDFPAAVSLYDAEGWLRVGAGRRLVGREVLDVWVYVSPPAGGGSPRSA